MVVDFKIQYFYDLKFLQIDLIFLCNTIQNPNGSAPSTPPPPAPISVCVVTRKFYNLFYNIKDQE